MYGFGRDGLDSSVEKVVPGTLRGFRHFRLSIAPPDGSLLSINDSTPYDTGIMKASCKPPRTSANPFPLGPDERHPETDAPAQKCTCGIYGWYNPSAIDPGFGRSSERVTGVIEASGKIVLGTRGFRAQAARIVAIVMPLRGLLSGSLEDQRIHAAAFHSACKRYGALGFTSLGELVEQYPPEDVTALIGEPQPTHSSLAAWDALVRGFQQNLQAIAPAVDSVASLARSLQSTGPRSRLEFEYMVQDAAYRHPGRSAKFDMQRVPLPDLCAIIHSGADGRYEGAQLEFDWSKVPPAYQRRIQDATGAALSFQLEYVLHRQEIIARVELP
jgi:hypothetical protein